jgi:hypothetical protein
MLEIGGDVGVLVYAALIIGLLIWLRQRVKQRFGSVQASHPVV